MVFDDAVVNDSEAIARRVGVCIGGTRLSMSSPSRVRDTQTTQ